MTITKQTPNVNRNFFGEVEEVTATIIFFHRLNDCEKTMSGRFHSEKVVNIPTKYLKPIENTNKAILPLHKLIRLGVKVPKSTHYLVEVEDEFDFN